VNDPRAPLSVFVVQVETTGLWEASCCNEACGYGLHCVSEDNPTREAAEQAATAHRRAVSRRLRAATARARQAEQGSALYWQGIAQQRERELKRAERQMRALRQTIDRARDLCARSPLCIPADDPT
jgi:hypothetical protein